MIRMKSMSKQFVAWATYLRNSPFLLARLKLTAIYILAILAVLAVFNVLVLGLFVQDLPLELETLATERAEEILENTLLVADAIILILVAGMSYVLAGFVLKPIEISYKQQKKFVADAAHELRTPLAVMKTGSETTLAGGKAEEQVSFIKDSLEEINHLSSTVDDLLMLAKSDNRQVPEFERVDLSKLVKQQTEYMQTYAKQKNISLKADIEDNCAINGSKSHIKRLLVNLIQNAVDYNNPNGEVRVLLKTQGDQVEIKVVDTGIGISKRDLPHIFDRFYKADKARTKTTNGAGLGLSIVKEIVDMHGGRISVASKPGAGTTVCALFPLYSSDVHI